MTTFCGCGSPIKGRFSKCFKCQLKAAREEGYTLGYSSGILKGEQNVKELGLTIERWRQLMSLCHPDKHGGSETAVAVTQWLAKQKPEG